MPQYTVEEALRVIGFGWRQWALCFACGLYWSADSLQMMFSAYFLPLVKVEFGLTQTEVCAHSASRRTRIACLLRTSQLTAARCRAPPFALRGATCAA